MIHLRPGSRGRLPQIPVLQYEDMRNNEAFPNFMSLPESDQDHRYYDQVRGQGPIPKKHWCLLAEIRSVVFDSRLVIECSDFCGYTVSVVFYTDDCGWSFHWRQSLDIGHTLAILYPNRRGLPGRPNAIRIEDASTVKVFPIYLENLLALSDDMQLWPVNFARHDRCHGCGRGASLRVLYCHHCGIVAYCSQECKRWDWHNRAHKLDCVILRDRDFREMIGMRWYIFNGPRRFPLRRALDYSMNGYVQV